MPQPDFSRYTEVELRQALNSIDAEKYPERAQDLASRLAAFTAIDAEAAPGPTLPASLAGYWRRIFAFLIDMLLLAVIGYIAGAIFDDTFVALGAWGRAVGFLIALAYFGIMESRAGGGASWGKQALGLQVITRDGALLHAPAAIGRAAIFCLAYFLNGASIGFMADHAWANWGVAIVIWGLIISVYYLLAFNRRTRQSIHDLAVGAFVVKAGAGAFVPTVRPVWRGHYAIMGGVLAALFAGFALLGKQENVTELAGTYQAISAVPGLRNVSVIENVNRDGQTKTRYLILGAVIDGAEDDPGVIAAHMAHIALHTYPGASSKDGIVVVLSSGYDIGIASITRSSRFLHTPEAWRALPDKPRG